MRALLLLLLATSAASAQTGTIEGTVLEADGVAAVIGANVRVGGTTLGAATDIDGRYRIIGVPVGMYTVVASYAGYLPVSDESVAVIDAGITPLTLTFLKIDSGFFITIDDSEIGRPLTTNDAIGQSRILYGYEIENMAVPR